MNKNIAIFVLFFLTIFYTMNRDSLSAQPLGERRIGDVIKFDDGSKGIVFYVDPSDATKGCAVALHDLKRTYALWSGKNHPAGLIDLSNSYFDLNVTSHADNGKENTRILVEAGLPAAEELKFYNGWYIPDALQLLRIVNLTPILMDAFESVDGDAVSLLERDHWTSSVKNQERAWKLIVERYRCESDSGSAELYIRPVRDFGGEAKAYWDSTGQSTMLVAPSTTTTYDASVTYYNDTFHLTGTAVVHPTYDKDTLYEITCESPLLYNSVKDTNFKNIDVQTAGKYVFRKRLDSQFYCDSIITLMLTVVPDSDCTRIVYDTICELKGAETYTKWKDTIFYVGTTTGLYELHGKKEIAPGDSIDTVLKLYLTVLPLPKVTINDLMVTCPLVGSQVMSATIEKGSAPYSYVWLAEGSGITLTDETTANPTVNIPAKCGVSYTIKLNVTDNNTCVAEQATKVITVQSMSPPVITTADSSKDLGCTTGSITAPTFTVTDNCEGSFTLPDDSVTVTGPSHVGCIYTQSWTAHYTDACGNKALDTTITYKWKETTTPTITTSLPDTIDLVCSSMIVAPTTADFTVTDGCDPSAMVTLIEGSEVVSGSVHTKTWTATYQNQCGQSALPVPITYKWTDVMSVHISCPGSFSDTLQFGDCTMKINPSMLGVPTVDITPSGSPYGLTSDFPLDSLFAEGEHFVSWIVLDSVCGHTDTCKQKVTVVFPKCPDAVDCEGNLYHGVRIGCDCWTQRNLESKKYSDCTDIPCVYNYASDMYPDTAANVSIYGRLYCYEGAVRDSADNGYGHIQGICPAGWYLPTPEKYVELNAYGVDALRSPSYWLGGGGNNSTGFTSLPAGYYHGASGRFENLRGEAYYWSTKRVNGVATSVAYIFSDNCNDITSASAGEGLGYSVRCIKEKE